MYYLDQLMDKLFAEIFTPGFFITEVNKSRLANVDNMDNYFPNYPVQNFYFTDDGNGVLEIATTGFAPEDIKVEIENQRLIIVGDKKPCDDEANRKYISRKIACRDFELAYKLSEAHDIDKISVELANGILKITMPLKPESKPIRKQLAVNVVSDKKQLA